jgi:hypothetical protein
LVLVTLGGIAVVAVAGAVVLRQRRAKPGG